MGLATGLATGLAMGLAVGPRRPEAVAHRVLCLERSLPHGAARSCVRGARSRRDGLAALDELHDLIRLAAQVAVGPEGVVPAAVSAATGGQVDTGSDNKPSSTRGRE